MPVTFAGDYAVYGGTSTSPTWTSNDLASTTVWPVWNQTFTSSSATNTIPLEITWATWMLPWVNAMPAPPPPTLPTPEQIAAREERRRAQAERERKQADEQAAAIAKAKALLEGFLTSEQIAQLAAQRWFEVVSQKGHRYRIHQGQVRNVRRVNRDGSLGMTFCIHPGESVPDEDAMLAQKLLLETDEEAFVRIANKS